MLSTRPSGPRVHLFSIRLLTCLLFAAVFLWIRPVAAQTTCDRAGCGTARDSTGTKIICFTPATAPPASLWSGAQLQPAYTGTLPPERDSTDFNEFTQSYNSRNWFQGLEIQNGYIFVALAHGIGVWDAHTDPANPVMLASIRYQSSATGSFPFLPVGELSKIVFGGIAAPDDSVAAIAGYSGSGILVFDTSDKSHPRPVYQNAGKSSDSVYAVKIGGTRYAFLAASGLYVYNLDQALTAGGCLETDGVNPGNCPGVLVKQVATASAGGYFVHGVDNYVVTSLSLGGFQIFDMSNPLNPVSKLVGSQNRLTQGVAMWKQGSTYYLAARLGRSATSGPQTAIYDVSCIASANGCASLGAPLALLNLDSASATEYLTFSRSGTTPFLYVGGDAYCSGADGKQHEWLLDVSNPAQPNDITPGNTTSVSAPYNGVNTPVTINYWSYFYRGSPTGFNLVAPRAGRFYGDYFYRMGRSIMDVHKWIHNTAPTADFSYSPAEIYASGPNTQGTPVTFSDRSSGLPTSWIWSFQDGTPATSTAQSPAGVVFSSAGTKSVSLTAGNAQGSNTTTPARSVVVLPPGPQIGGLTVSPANPQVCQQVTVTATGVTGVPALTYSWGVTDSGNNAVPASSSTGTLNWPTTGLAAGSYTATVTVTNGAGTASKPVAITLNPLPALTDISGAAPAVAVNNNTVKLTVPASQGATAWAWDFGDGTKQTITDPVQGPSPTHVYASIGQYSATVTISNCVNQTGFTSKAVSVNVLQTAPLKAAFQAQLVTCVGTSCSASTGQPISFLDSSTGAEFWDYDWEHASNSVATCSFTDTGHTAPVLTPHVYNTAGDYYPCLRVRRGANEQDIAMHADIRVSTGNGGGGGGTQAITISGPGSGVVGTPYTFSATASNCTAASGGWTWSASGGTVSGTQSSSAVTITWASAGAKTVTASNTGCSNFGSYNVTISDNSGGGGNGGGGGTLGAQFSFSPSSPNPGDAVSFDGGASTGSPVSYSWDFGDGTGTVTGKTATHSYTAAGSYAAKLTVSAPGTGCPFAPCVVSSSTTKTVTVNGTPPPTVSADFAANVTCTNVGGFDECQANTGQAVTFTPAVTDANSYQWNFGDGSTATTATASHAFSPAGIYLVTLTVTKGSATASKSRRMIVAGTTPPPASKAVVLPWIAQTRGALVQSSDLYIHNPSANPMSVTLQFRKRGLPDTNPPTASKTIAPGATVYIPDVLGGLFNRENIAGFISLAVDQGDMAPVITSYNTTFQADGKQFGQTISGISMSSLANAAKADPVGQPQNLVGLINNSDRLAYFGVSNPSENAVNYRLRLFDKTGSLIGQTSQDLTVAPFGQRQFQSAEIESTFGVTNQDDYRVEVQATSSGGALVPYASNLRLSSQDPSFIEAGSSSNSKAYLLGALSAPGANGTLWQTDLLLSNVNSQPVSVDVTFTGIGVNAVPTTPLHVTLQPGETQRLQNVISGQWKINNAIGLLTLKSTSPNGVFPIAQAESYDNSNPAKRFGQSMAALTDANAAGAGQGQYLAGLRQDATHRTTLWLYNPGDANGVYDLVYRNLDGTVIATTANVQLAGGKLRQISPSQLPLPAAGAKDGLTLQIVVKSGKVLSAAQVVDNGTNDPSYIQGDVR